MMKKELLFFLLAALSMVASGHNLKESVDTLKIRHFVEVGVDSMGMKFGLYDVDSIFETNLEKLKALTKGKKWKKGAQDGELARFVAIISKMADREFFVLGSRGFYGPLLVTPKHYEEIKEWYHRNKQIITITNYRRFYCVGSLMFPTEFYYPLAE